MHSTANSESGSKLQVGCLSTGERGDRVLLDDPHNVIKAESDTEREKTVRFVRKSMSNRLNDEQSAIVVIMQRLHDSDVSGDILRREANYCHMLIPMYFDPLRYPASEDGTVTEDPETGEASRPTRSAGSTHGPRAMMVRCSRPRGWPPGTVSGVRASRQPRMQPSVALDRSSSPPAHVKTGLSQGGSRVEFGQVLFIPLDRNKDRSSFHNSPGKSTQLDPIADRQLFDLIVSQFPLHARLWLPDAHPRWLRPWFRMARQLIPGEESALPR
jgi:hypothetical protein